MSQPSQSPVHDRSSRGFQSEFLVAIPSNKSQTSFWQSQNLIRNKRRKPLSEAALSCKLTALKLTAHKSCLLPEPTQLIRNKLLPAYHTQPVSSTRGRPKPITDSVVVFLAAAHLREIPSGLNPESQPFAPRTPSRTRDYLPAPTLLAFVHRPGCP